MGVSRGPEMPLRSLLDRDLPHRLGPDSCDGCDSQALVKSNACPDGVYGVRLPQCAFITFVKGQFPPRRW